MSDVQPRGAAYSAGVMVGDRIVAVNGVPFDHVTHEEVVNAIKAAIPDRVRGANVIYHTGNDNFKQVERGRCCFFLLTLNRQCFQVVRLIVERKAELEETAGGGDALEVVVRTLNRNVLPCI